MSEWLEIYSTAFKVGGLTFGGGYAMLPILQKEVVEKKKWNTEEEILDYYALSQCIPGIIMVNTLVFIGQHRKGRLGGVISALGSVTPALIIISIIASLLTTFSSLSIVQNAFAGIRVCVCVLILNSVLKLWKSSVVDKVTLILFIGVTLGSLLLDLSPFIFVIISGILGIFVQMIGKKK